MIDKLISVDIVDEMKESYLAYAMSVITARALPDVRDGLKPVHRRILFAMHEMGLTASARFRKSAAVVGDVLGKYHPHGDVAVYDSMVGMAQEFSYRYPLILGQGNFGCFTKDTKVELTDGRKVSFARLIEEEKQGKENYTYTVDEKGHIKIGKILKPRLTIKNANIIKVILDNGEEIKCTPNHKFMLRNGDYKEAQNLKPKDSLMPLYIRLSEFKDTKPALVGYPLIYQPQNKEWVFAHHMADEYNLNMNKYVRSRGRVRHHVDFNKLNANPDNIKRMGWKEHWMLHANLSKERHKNDLEYVQKLKKGREIFWSIPKYYPTQNLIEISKDAYNNHKVFKVEFLTQKEDVYDLTINNTHNFALASGIFVHNSIDGDNAAAMRYTEAKMSKISSELLRDLEKETVDFRPNYDQTRKEPIVFPSSVPGLLLNGTLGIAVGMATNIPPHNLAEVLDATNYLIENEDANTEELMQFIKGPDFPTGGIAYGYKDMLHAYSTGRGGVVCRGEAEIVEHKGGSFQIIITSIPYRVNKSNLIIAIAELVQEKKIDGIKGLRDESTRDIRIVIDLKSGAYPEKILNYIYKNTQLESNFNFNIVALVEGVPQTLSLKSILSFFILHRKEIVKRRSIYDLKKAEEREHILLGLKKALDFIDKVIKTIRASKDGATAKIALMKQFKFSDLQAVAILEMKLQKLAGLERKAILDELEAKQKFIKEIKELLASPKKMLKVIADELKEIKEKYADVRRTKIIKGGVKEISDEDLIPEKETVLVFTSGGYIKRTDPGEYHSQKRGGVGVVDLETKEEDFVTILLSSSTHSDLLFFTNLGKAYNIKMYDIPEGRRATKGKSIMNFLALNADEKVTSILPIPKDLSKEKEKERESLMLVTKNGIAKKMSSDSFKDVRRSGIISIKLDKGDELISALLTNKGNEVMLATAGGQSIRFKESDVREMGRTAGGVRGIKLSKNDEVIGVDVVKKDPDGKQASNGAGKKESSFLTMSANGFGKKTLLKEYKVQKRGGSGIKTAKVTTKTGKLIVATVLSGGEEELIAMSKKGQVIRTALENISSLGRQTQGVTIMRLRAGDGIASITCV